MQMTHRINKQLKYVYNWSEIKNCTNISFLESELQIICNHVRSQIKEISIKHECAGNRDIGTGRYSDGSHNYDLYYYSYEIFLQFFLKTSKLNM